MLNFAANFLLFKTFFQLFSTKNAENKDFDQMLVEIYNTPGRGVGLKKYIKNNFVTDVRIDESENILEKISVMLLLSHTWP